MPTGTLPNSGSLGDTQITTGDYQTQINQVLAYVRSLKAEVGALSGTEIKEGAVRGVGDGAGLLADKAVLDSRLGDLGSAALKDYEMAVVDLGGDFVAGPYSFVKCTRIGDIVCISAYGDYLEYLDEYTQPTSAPGEIPSQFRPTNGTSSNIYFQDAVVSAQIDIYTDGTLRITHRTSSGSLEPRNSTPGRPSITFVR